MALRTVFRLKAAGAFLPAAPHSGLLGPPDNPRGALGLRTLHALEHFVHPLSGIRKTSGAIKGKGKF